MYPNWLDVEYAITRFTSFWTKPEDAAKKAVKAPIKEMKAKIEGTNENIGDNLINKKTPAVTIVAACNNADTGVGPSIASGNHVCKPNWADLDNTPINSINEIKVWSVFNKLNIISKSNDP